MSEMPKKILKDVIKNEVSPLLIGLRNDLQEGNQIAQKKFLFDQEREESKLSKTITESDLKLLKNHIEKSIPKLGKDFFTKQEIKDFKKEIKPKKGVDYFTEEEIFKIKKSITPVKGRDYVDGYTPQKGVDYFTEYEVKSFIERVTPQKGVHYFDGEKGEKGLDGTEISAEQIRSKLETLTGSARLKINAIAGLKETLDQLKMNTLKTPSSGGGLAEAGVESIADMIRAGSNISITGAGTSTNPFIISAVDIDPASLLLDQTTPQTIINGAPIFAVGIALGDGTASVNNNSGAVGLVGALATNAINISAAGSAIAEIDVSLLTTNRTFSLPDNTGILALIGDNVSRFVNDAGYITSNGISSLITGEIPIAGSPTTLTSSIGYSINATASNLVERDSNANIFANNIFTNSTSVVSAGAITVLTVASARHQTQTGSGSQTFQLPDATTLSLSHIYTFNNNSSGSLIITDNSTATQYTTPAGGYIQAVLMDNSTATGVWDFHAMPPKTVTWGSGITGLVMNSALSTSAMIGAGASGSTSPVFIPQRGSSTTGFGGDSSNLYGIIAGSAKMTLSATNMTVPAVNKVTITTPATGSTLTIVDGKTLTVSNTLTLAGTDGSTLNIGSGGTLGSNAFTSTAYEPTANKATDFSVINNTLFPTVLAVKNYTDALAQGLSVKPSATVATTAALPANTYSNGSSGVGATLTGIATGVLTIDGYTVALNDYILVKNEATGANNGLYKCTTAGAIGVAYVLTRAVEMDIATEFVGAFMFIEQGTVNLSSGWVCTNATAPTIGTTAITFTQFSGAGEIIAGTGLLKSGNTLSVDTSIIVDKTSVQALTHKDLTAATNTFPIFNQNTTGSAANLSISGQTGLLSFSGLTSTNRTKTVRDAADTILENGGSYNPTGVWTNMLLTSPKITTSILDTNGNTLINIGAITNAVNYLKVTNAATGTAGPILSPDGETNIDLKIAGKGTGKVHHTTGAYGDVTSYTPAAAATATLTLNTSNIHAIQMPAGNITISVSNDSVGQIFTIEIKQDSAGSRTVTWFSGILWAGGTAPTLTTTPNKVDIFTFRVLTAGSAYYGMVSGQNI